MRPLSPLMKLNGKMKGADCFLYVDIWNVMCDSLFALLSGK